MRADLSRAALRAIGTIALCGAALTGVNYWNFRRLDDAGVIDKLESFERVQRVIGILDLATVVAMAAAVVLLVFTRPREQGRPLAIGAAALASVAALARIFLYLKPPETMEGHEKLRPFYLAMGIAGIVVVVLSMLSITRSRRRGPLAVVTGVVALMFTLVPFLLGKGSRGSMIVLHFGSMAGSDLALGIGPLVLAQFAHEESVPGPVRADGAPLRLLASAFAWRIVIGIVAVVITTVAVANKTADLAGGIAALAAMASFGCTVAMIVGLARHLRSEAPGMMPSAVVFAIVAAAIAVVVDISATSAGMELFEIIGKVQSAKSFWEFPSMKKLEDLQETVRFASRVQIGLGAAATFALALSFRSTARACKSEGAEGLAARVMVLSIVAAGAAFGISVLMEKPKANEELLFASVAAIALAIWLIASWLGLLRELAGALDDGANEPQERAAS